MKRKSSRRDFLKGKSAADAMADRAPRRLPSDAPPEARKPEARKPEARKPEARKPEARKPEARKPDPAESYLVRITRRAMACEFEVRLNAGQYRQGTGRALEALDLVDALEDQLSIFRENSEICRINRAAAEGPVEVEPKLFELLEAAVRHCRETEGAFDLTSARLWEAWGFARRAGAIPQESELAEALKLLGSHLLELDPQHRTIRFLEPGVQLNLGSVGKGFALDRCGEFLAAGGIEHFLIHGGNSSVLARGSQGPTEDGSDEAPPQGWEVGVLHPLRPDRRLAVVRLRNRALATSGSWAQSFVHQGRRYSHILDPRTGRPAEGVLSATAIAPTATLADALSTAFFVMGPDATRDYCRDRPEIAAVLACPVRHSGGIEIRTAGVREEEVTLL